MADGDWLSFHQFLAAWRIQQSEALRSSHWKWVLDTYFRFGARPQHLHENGVKAISAFHVLRKLAYLALDMHESHGLCILNLSKIKQSLLFAEIWKWSSKYDHFGLLLNTLKVHLGYTLYTNYEVSKLNLAFLDSYRFKVESESDMTIEEWKLRLMDAFREGKKLEEVEVSSHHALQFSEVRSALILTYLHVLLGAFRNWLASRVTSFRSHACLR